MNQNDFSNQKRDAIEKMKQMHKKAENIGEKPKNEGSAKKAEPKVTAKLKQNGSAFPFLDSLFENSDMTVIIGLLLLLMSEKADKKLLFALVYILL